MKKILMEILQELKSINKKLQAIESSEEQRIDIALDHEIVSQHLSSTIHDTH